VFSLRRLADLTFLLAVLLYQPQTLTAQLDPDVVQSVDSAVVTIKVGHTLGSGFLLDGDKTIITNYHVIEGATKVTVVFPGVVEYEAVGFLAISPGKDLAIIRMAGLQKEHRVNPIKLAQGRPKKGETVFAIGAPEGLEDSVSQGIVSAIRDFHEIQKQTGSKFEYDRDSIWIQTTAAISGGNSGGPLFNTKGEVIGLNTWSRAGKNRSAQNLNFAISSAHVGVLLAKAGDVRPFSELPPPRRGPDPVSPSTPPLAPTVPLLKPYVPGKGTLQEQIAALKEHIDQRRQGLAAFNSRAKTNLLRHPARGEYLAAMSASEPVRAELASIQAKTDAQNQSWAQAKAQVTAIYADLDGQQANELQNVTAQYQQQLFNADQFDRPLIEARLRNQQSLISGRYDRLRRDARARYAQVADGFRQRVDELTSYKLTIESTRLVPLMVQAQPYLDFAEGIESQRKALEREIPRYTGRLNQLEARAKRERPLVGEEAEAAASRAMKHANSLIARNPTAAYERLAELAAKYPTTESALEAKELLLRKGEAKPRTPKNETVRTWTSLDGNYQVEAKYVGYKSGKVGLSKADGKVVSVPFERLSEADRRYVLGL
jgi:V8-like Glu-specific endopeptidase